MKASKNMLSEFLGRISDFLKAKITVLWSKLSNQVGPKAAVVYASLVGALVAIMIVSIISTSVRSSEFSNLVAAAEAETKAGNFDTASSLVAKALDASPERVAEVEEVLIHLELRREGALIFSEFDKSIAEGDYFTAVRSMNSYQRKIRFNSRLSDLSPLVEKKIASVKKESLKYAVSRSEELFRKNRNSEALALLSLAEDAYGSTPEITRASAKYKSELAAELKATRARAVSNLSSRKDSFTGITWYRDPSSPRYRNSNGFYIYFGVKEDRAYSLRLVTQYFDDDWLFINKAQVSVDGEIYDLGVSDWERDNNSQIWEWFDEPLADRAMIEAIIKSKKAVIRFEGDQYFDTRTISNSQKIGLRKVLAARDSF